MGQALQHSMQVEGELHAPAASAQLVRFNFPQPIEAVMQVSDTFRIDLCLTPRPRNARAAYPARWGRRRFERLGKVFVVPPGESMLAASDGHCQQASLVCSFRPQALPVPPEVAQPWSDQRLAAGLDLRDTTIRSLLLRLARETRAPGFASAVLVELLAAQLAIELVRHGAALGGERGAGLAAWQLRRIDERLRELDAPPTLGELAALCGLSVRQLTRGFRASRGCSVGDSVALARVERAKTLLRRDGSVKAIAFALGFSSASSFCQAFRRATGESPGHFRQRLRGA